MFESRPILSNLLEPYLLLPHDFGSIINTNIILKAQAQVYTEGDTYSLGFQGCQMKDFYYDSVSCVCSLSYLDCLYHLKSVFLEMQIIYRLPASESLKCLQTCSSWNSLQTYYLH